MAAMEQVFRCAVGAGPLGGPLVDDERYREAWATMCGYRALAMVTWFSPDLLAQNRPWTPGWTRRAALISTTLRLRQASAGVATLEPLCPTYDGEVAVVAVAGVAVVIACKEGVHRDVGRGAPLTSTEATQPMLSNSAIQFAR
jgi:hypothetical protein